MTNPVSVRVVSGTSTERGNIPASTARGMEFRETDTGIRYESDGTTWIRLGGSRAQTDDSGNTIVPAFSPGTPTDLSAAFPASSATQALGTANSIRIQGLAAGNNFIRIKFVNAVSGTASSTTDMLLNCNKANEPEKFYIPISDKDTNGNSWLAFIINTAAVPGAEGAAVPFQITTG